MLITQLTWIALSSIRTRFGSSLVTVVGTGALVVLLLFFAVITASLQRTLISAGRSDRALVLRSGSDSEAASRFERGVVHIVGSAAGIQHDAGLGPIASAELVTGVRLGINTDNPIDLTVRGVDSMTRLLRPEMKLSAGRMFKPGSFEMIVGRTAQENATGRLALGAQVPIGGTRWTVVGEFRSQRDVHEAEVLVDLRTLLSAYRSNQISSVVVRLRSREDFEVFKADVTSRPNLSVDVHRESDYYSAAAQKSSALISVVSTVVCGLMALGSVIAATHTVYSAVSSRAGELATLRAIGFPDSTIVASVVAETVLLGAFGALLGVSLLWALLGDQPVPIQSVGGWSMIVVTFSMSASSIGSSVLVTVVACVVGSLVPAYGIVRAPVAESLRSV